MITWIIGSITLFAVLLYGALGEIITEKSGHLNLGTPGAPYNRTANNVIDPIIHVIIIIHHPSY